MAKNSVRVSAGWDTHASVSGSPVAIQITLSTHFCRRLIASLFSATVFAKIFSVLPKLIFLIKIQGINKKTYLFPQWWTLAPK